MSGVALGFGMRCTRCPATFGRVSVQGPGARLACPMCGAPLAAATRGVDQVVNVQCRRCGTRIGSLTVMNADGLTPRASCPVCDSPI